MSQRWERGNLAAGRCGSGWIQGPPHQVAREQQLRGKTKRKRVLDLTTRRNRKGPMDPVSLTIGIVPLLGGSIKLFRASQSKFRAFRHYSREVDRIRKQFERQRQFFLNEIHLALRLVLDDESLIRQMVGDGGHPKWHSEGLETLLIDRFHANNCHVLNEIVDEIGKTITAIQEGLECFSCFEEEARQKVSIPPQICCLVVLTVKCREKPPKTP